MTKRNTLLLLLSLAVLFGLTSGASQPAPAQTRSQRADARVAKALTDLGLKYKVDEYGDYDLLMTLDNNRQQVVTVGSEVLRAKGTTPFRIVKSIAMLSSGALPAAVRERLRRANTDYDPFEPWQVVKYKDGTAAEFQWFAEADCSDLEDAINKVAEDTDKMELEITGEDNF
jgi:hypothetical protein